RSVLPTWSLELPLGELRTLGTKTRIAVTSTDVGLLQGAVLGSHTVTADHLQRWLSEDWRHGPPAWPGTYAVVVFHPEGATVFTDPAHALDRKSTRLNSSHVSISYAVFCLKKK